MRLATSGNRGTRKPTAMRTSTLILAFGAGLFVLPIPGTFIGGALVLLVGLVVRWLGN